MVSGPESYPRRGERKREDKDCPGSCPSQPLGETSILNLGFLICKVGLPSTCPGWRRPCAQEAPPPGAQRTEGELRLVQMSFTEPSLAGQAFQPPAVLQVVESVTVVGPDAGDFSAELGLAGDRQLGHRGAAGGFSYGPFLMPSAGLGG